MYKKLSLFRLPNLMIIIIVQAAIFYGVLLPHLAKNSIFPVLNGFLFPVFIFITVLITAAGYLINDITDIEIDSINKPERMVIGKSLSLKNAWHLYYFMLVQDLFYHCGLLFISQNLIISCFISWQYRVCIFIQ